MTENISHSSVRAGTQSYLIQFINNSNKNKCDISYISLFVQCQDSYHFLHQKQQNVGVRVISKTGPTSSSRHVNESDLVDPSDFQRSLSHKYRTAGKQEPRYFIHSIYPAQLEKNNPLKIWDIFKHFKIIHEGGDPAKLTSETNSASHCPLVV